MKGKRTGGRDSRQVVGTIAAIVGVGALCFYAGYRYGLTRAAAPAAEAPATRSAAARAAGGGSDKPADANFRPRTVTERTGNFLANPGFEQGAAGWKWLDWSREWGPFEMADGKGTDGSRAAHLKVRGSPTDRPTRVHGVVQELAPAAFPQRISGRYFVERWEAGDARKAYVQVVIISMLSRGGLPSMQIRYVLDGVTEQPYQMSNARYRFIRKRRQPETGRWIDFSLAVQDDYRELWGEVPPDGTPFRVLFEARYDDKPPGGTVTADVYYDDLFVGAL